MDRDGFVCIEEHHAARKGRTWCGEITESRPTFEYIENAAYNGLVENDLTVCPECVTKIIQALENK